MLAALLAVGLSAPAAAATWTEPVSLLGGSVFLWSSVGAQIVYSADGRAMAWWPAAVDPMTLHTVTAVRDAGGAWRGGAALPAGVIPDFVSYGRARVIGLEYREALASAPRCADGTGAGGRGRSRLARAALPSRPEARGSSSTRAVGRPSSGEARTRSASRASGPRGSRPAPW
jgi:hypothetical protein